MTHGLSILMDGLVGLCGAMLGIALGGLVANLLKLKRGDKIAAFSGLGIVGALAGVLVMILGAEATPRVARTDWQGVPIDDTDGPQLTAIKTFYPEDYQRILSVVAAKKASGASRAETLKAVHHVFLDVGLRAEVLADNDNALKLMEEGRREAEFLAVHDPQTCYQQVAGDPGEVDPELLAERTMEAGFRDKDAETQFAPALLEQAAKRPQAIDERPDLMAKLPETHRRAFDELPPEEQPLAYDALTRLPASPSAPEAKATCDFAAIEFKIIRRLGRNDAAALYRMITRTGLKKAGWTE